MLTARTFSPQYKKSAVGFGATIIGEQAYNSIWLRNATKYLKWIYITDQNLPNPYAKFPPYFNQYLSDLSALASTSTTTTTTSTTTTTILRTKIETVVRYVPGSYAFNAVVTDK